jgi:hypothetical protein
VGFFTINPHPRPDPSPCSSAIRATGRNLSHRPRSALPALIWSMGFRPRHWPQFAQWAAIRPMRWYPPHRPRTAPSVAICAGTLKKTKQNRSLRCKFKGETAQVKRVNSINL